MGLKRSVKKLDIFGKPVQLRLEKRKVHKTLCGGIVTLFIIISVVLITIYYGLKLYYKQNPAIDQINTINSGQIIQAQSFKFGFAINIFSKDHLSQANQGVFQINEQLFSNQSSTLINKGFSAKAFYSTRVKINQSDYEEKQFEIPLMPCSSNEQFLKYWDKVFALPDNKKEEYLCPFFQDSLSDLITIQGGISQETAKQISIIVEIQDEIKQNSNWKDMLTNSLVVLKVLDEMAFLESYENPVQTYSRTIIDWIDLDKIKFIQLKHNQQLISTDKGIYFSDNQDQYLKSISDICYFNKKNDLSSSSQVLNIFTQVNQTKQVFMRSYFKASVMLAYIGGFLQLTLILGKSITKPFSKLSFYTSLVNEVFQFEDDKQKDQQEEYKLNETEQKPFQQSTCIQQTTTAIDETANKNANQSILKSRSLFFPNSQKKDSIDTSQEITQQAQEPITSPNILHIKNSRNSYMYSKNNEDENAKKTQGTDSKKNSVYSMHVSELNTPIQIKKKSLFKNQNLLQNFREYFEADRLEKRLIISVKIVLVEFFQKIWIFIKLICSKDKIKNNKHFYTAIEKLKFSKNKVNERLDIIYIVQKLQEIDKLKQIVLDKNQRKLFEYLPRPVLKNEYIFQKAPTQKMKSYSKTQEWSILKQEESIQQKAIKAWIAFTEISNKECLERKDRKVIRLLDVKAKNIFEITSKKIHEELFDQQSNNIKIKGLCNAYGQNYQTNESVNISRKNSLQQTFGQRKSKNLIQFINVQTSGKRNSSSKGSIKKKASLRDMQIEQFVSVNCLEQTQKSCEFQEIQQKQQSQTVNQIKESKSVTHASQQSSDSSFSSSESSSNSNLSDSSVQCHSQLDTVYQNKHATIKQTNFKEQSEFQKQNNLKIELNEIPENIEKSYRNSQDNTVNKSSVEQNSYFNDNSNKDKQQCQYIQSFQANISLDQAKLNVKNAQNQDLNSKEAIKRGSQTEKFQDKKFNLFNAYFNQVKNQDDQHIEQIKLKNSQQGPLNLQPILYQGQMNNLLASQKSPTTPQMLQPFSQFKNEDDNLKKQNKEDLSNNLNVQKYKSFIRKRNNYLNNQQFTTPQYFQKRKTQEDYSDIYNSASFTQFMKKITPIIAINKVENCDDQ
ncbi:transmembrane protein, putative (macronuclear) [Tetrahymena thermophila SB210]|uniref:Transmembrane protein, putative n=1 Tax=Tetrahymena thermophila (strain SB210) TaxID=312017 RepID=Q22YY1_TETTS|nr:transmembrane protein, putative [Tetrahymena thermophila SB210]EAR90540.1 transmembrane protein, putative [Tetrahymena thermophila SB210]|eukprot:XP_001010785.1 transmembrane protein, putative [Tetrahymena thermophila SB210]